MRTNTNQNILERDIKDQYLDVMERFGGEDEDVRIRDVLKVVFKYFLTYPRKYFRESLQRNFRKFQE